MLLPLPLPPVLKLRGPLSSADTFFCTRGVVADPFGNLGTVMGCGVPVLLCLGWLSGLGVSFLPVPCRFLPPAFMGVSNACEPTASSLKMLRPSDCC